MVLYDVNRSKCVMLVKKRKREMLEAPPSKERLLKRLWILVSIMGVLFAASYIMDSSSEIFSNVYPEFKNVIMGIPGSLAISIYIIIAWLSSSRKVFYFLVQERRIIFILILLGILFYVDNIVLGWSATGLLYPITILAFISFDMNVMHFPRRLLLTLLILIVLVTLWNIFNHTFLIANCEQYMLPWGIFGENISYCTIKRLIFQTILSLMVPAAITLLNGRTDNLFFCNVNIYRSTGTVDRRSMNPVYVSSMHRERARSIAAKQENIAVEMV